jgi:hypothetical protein
LPGAEPLVTPYAPNFLLEGGTLDIATPGAERAIGMAGTITAR